MKSQGFDCGVLPNGVATLTTGKIRKIKELMSSRKLIGADLMEYGEAFKQKKGIYIIDMSRWILVQDQTQRRYERVTAGEEGRKITCVVILTEMCDPAESFFFTS
jgi:hypothetical protein